MNNVYILLKRILITILFCSITIYLPALYIQDNYIDAQLLLDSNMQYTNNSFIEFLIFILYFLLAKIYIDFRKNNCII